MVKEILFGMVGGLGLFLFGMRLLSDGLKKAAGHKLRSLLELLTKHRVIAVLIGALTTCLIQSSSATTVMTVGFVNAGLLTLKQALCVILGANVGTTFTAWIVSAFGIQGLKITTYALPAVGVGFVLLTVGKSQKVQSAGNVMLGFGLLFIGISFMKDAFGPLSGSAEVQAVLIKLGENPVLAVLAGTAITLLLQSSSASIMIIQVLAFQGAFGSDWEVALKVAIPFILGDNIGTTITAQLAALQASRNSKRAAMGHTIFNLIGVLYILPLVWVGWFDRAVRWVTPFGLSQGTIMLHIALAHSLFNVVNVLIFLPAVSWLEAVVMRLLPVREDERIQKPVTLEKHLLRTPVIALFQARREILRMASEAKSAVGNAIDGMVADDRKQLQLAMETEDFIDELQYEITSYLAALAQTELSEELSRKLPVLLHTVNDLERIGDHAVNIVEVAERKIANKLTFSNSALEDVGRLREQFGQMFDYVMTALKKDDTAAAQLALDNEKNLNNMQIEFRRSHVSRMSQGQCSPEAGLIFIDLVDNVEKVGDHLTNIAQAVIGGLEWDGIQASRQ
ncbi:MAG TPA: Na/Pi cotransporter family protein [Sedimentisphaerales bacterium]|nr:Na/Pi cotransporter family protein [Sedimentisphaerales bacterium]